MRLFLIFIALIIGGGRLAAQECPEYPRLIKQAGKLSEDGKFIDALNMYQAAQRYCKAKEDEVYELIKKMFLKIGKLKDVALSQKDDIEKKNNKLKKLVDAFYFYDGKYALAYKEGGFYYIDKSGNAVVKLKAWRYAEQFDNITGLANVSLDGRRILLDTTGKIYFLNNDYSDDGVEEADVLWLDNKDITNLNISAGSSLDYSKMAIINKSENLLSDSNFDYWQKGGKNLIDPVEYLRADAFGVKWLDLRRNRLADITSLNENILLDSLKILNLESNSISNLSGIGKFKNLRMLNLSENKIDSLPEEIGRLENLAILDISDNNSLVTLPVSLGDLQNLKILNLSYLNLKTLPTSIEKLKNLSIIVLFWNQEGDWTQIFEVLLKQGKKIIVRDIPDLLFDLGTNSPTEGVIPSRLKRMLNAGDIYRLSKDTLYVVLLESDFRKIFLSAKYPACFKEFNNPINLEGLKLVDVPKQTFEWSKLKILNLINNQLTNLPKEINKLTELEQLYLGQNQLNNLPDELKSLEKLKIFSIANNPLPVNIISKIFEGSSKKIRFKIWQFRDDEKPLKNELIIYTDITQLVQLSKLKLAGNMQNIDLSKIRRLNLSHQGLQKLPDEIKELKNLKFLNIGDNNFSPQEKERIKRMVPEGCDLVF
jgi:leucine-rich repeat protein SHOC2